MYPFSALREKIRMATAGRGFSARHSVERAIDWIQVHRLPGAGIPAWPKSAVPFQEVTGYLIPTLYNFGEKDLARDLARWEASVQTPEGSFCATDHVPYTFDTAQVVRGFLAVLHDLPEIEGNLRRACDYVAGNIAADGEVLTPAYDQWMGTDGNIFSEYMNLYALPPLAEAGRRLSEPRYTEAAARALAYFKTRPDLTQFKPEKGSFTHVFGYMMDGLAELGEIELAREGLSQAAAIQKENGAIPAYPGADWICSTGMAQLAVAWYKIGEKRPADRALEFLEKIQHRSGGFYGSYGGRCPYFPKSEISWAVKFFLDAYLLRIQQDFNDGENGFFPDIEKSDGRVQEILGFFGNLDGKRVLDVGCGKGRYVRVLQETFPGAEIHGIDLSEKMLGFCPPGAVSKVGNMLNLEYPDDFFDCVYSVEALEHALRIEPAIRDMVRILKPGGKIMIVDKSVRKMGELKIKPWERWFSPEEIAGFLQKYRVVAGYKAIAYGRLVQPDGLFIAWGGVKQDF
jgi:malonyl-CoA O-methyltransferase